MISPTETGPEPMELHARLDLHDQEATYQLTNEELSKLLQSSTDHAIEGEPTVTLGKEIDFLSTNGAIAREVLLNGKKIGTLIKFETQDGREPKAMLVHATTKPEWFIKQPTGREHFTYSPNITAIKEHFALTWTQPGTKKQEITMMVNGPTFENYGSPELTGVNYDNGKFIGSEKLLTDEETSGRWIGYIANGKMTLSHSTEITQEKINQLITEKRDIFMMSSLKRNGNLNTQAALRHHDNAHTLVQFDDGSIGELILNNCSDKDKIAVVSSLDEIQRAFYSDADAASNYLDGIRVNTKGGLRYSHPNNGDLFQNPKAPATQMVVNNMPALIIFFAQEK